MNTDTSKNKRMLRNTDFIVFSDDWGRHPFSCQHIMEHFLPGNKLLWVNTIGLRTPAPTLYDVKRAFEKAASWLRPEKPGKGSRHENLRVISPVMIPYNAIGAVRAFNRRSVIRAVRRAMRAWGFNAPVLLATQPLASEYAGSFGERLIVYYCVDDFTLWPGMNQPELVASMENALLSRADLVVAVSDLLRVTRNNGKSPTRLLTHGVDIPHFSRASLSRANLQELPHDLPRDFPQALRHLSGPIIGFYGLIDERFDQDLVAAILAARPEWQIVCIGNKLVDLGRLEKSPNFHRLPAVSYEELPAYAAFFDAAIIPYTVNALTRAVNPLKLREYIATGKPVITTPMAEVFRFKDIVSIADGAPAFIAAIAEALEERPDSASREERMAKALEGESWADKAAQFSAWMEEALERKQKPRVFIAMATGILGGPGKGLVQFLRHGGLEGSSPIVIDYHRGFERGETEFVKAVKATGATIATLEQRSVLDASLMPQAMEIIREHRVTILQSHGYKSHLLCWLLARKTGLPWIAFVHGWTRENMRIRFYTALEHLLLLGADEVIAVSESLRAKLLPSVRKRCRVIPNALAPEEMIVDSSRAAMRNLLGFDENALVAGMVGRLSPEKGHSVFLRALAAARRVNPSLRGLIVGDGQEKGALKAEAKLLGLGETCVFTGHVENPAAYYGAMDILAMPSFAEGMPNAALEGMFMELPLVATRVGGIPEVAADGETGLLIPPGRVEALTDALLILAASSERRKTMGRAGAERIRTLFSPEIRANRILSIYRNIRTNAKQQEALR